MMMTWLALYLYVLGIGVCAMAMPPSEDRDEMWLSLAFCLLWPISAMVIFSIIAFDKAKKELREWLGA